MAARHYYLLSALPHLGELGSQPPVSGVKLLELVAESGGPIGVMEALLLSDDLLQRDAVLAGELTTAEAEPCVLNVEQLGDEEPMPGYLVIDKPEDSSRLVTDVTWEAYFRHASATAQKFSSKMLGAWVGAEVALRNALAAARARALSLDAETYMVATDLADSDADFSAAISEWSAAPNPLAGMKAIDAARWEWLRGHEEWFSFGDDELAVYAARIMLLARWQRMEKGAARVDEMVSIAAEIGQDDAAEV